MDTCNAHGLLICSMYMGICESIHRYMISNWVQMSRSMKSVHDYMIGTWVQTKQSMNIECNQYYVHGLYVKYMDTMRELVQPAHTENYTVQTVCIFG